MNPKQEVAMALSISLGETILIIMLALHMAGVV
jgi:hypothetical protein